jgi:sulfoquinovosidase
VRAPLSLRAIPFLSLAVSTAFVLVGGACSDEDPVPPGVAAGASGASGGNGGKAALVPSIGAFGLSTDEASTALTISASSDGRALFEGLPPSDDVGQGFAATEEDPPMTGFAVRDVTRTSTMLFGSFKHDEVANGPWKVARRLVPTGDGHSLDLIGDADTKLATLTLTQGDDAHHLVVAIAPGEGTERRFSWGIRCEANDHFQGFGAQTWGVDARGESIPVWVAEQGILKDLDTDDPKGSWFSRGRRHSSYLPMPEFLSSRRYFAVAETDTLSTFAMCSEREDVARLQLELPVTLHLFEGDDLRAALTRKTAHFGRARVPPSFAFAPWNDAIFGSAEVRRVAKVIREAKIPSSVIWSEDWRGGEPSAAIADGYALLEEWDLDRTLYPDFEVLAKELHDDGFKWMVYFNPFVEKQSKAWPETAPLGYLIKKGDVPYEFDDAKFEKASLVDFTNPDANAWAIGKMKTSLDLGADGWMGDFSEWLPTDATLAGGSGEAWHNRYPVLWQKAQRAALDSATEADSIERLTFVRTGWFGTPALADVFWAGDQSTDFRVDDGMPTVIPMGLGIGLAGISTYGSDIGGYNTLSTTPTTKEVFFRWTELGAWSPVMRTHHGTAPKVSWRFDSDDETLAHWKRYAELHVALTPYWEGLTQIAHDRGIPVWRSLALDFGDDLATWPIQDEFFVGDGVLVAPIQVAGALSRSVYLPAGTYFPWEGGASLAGGATVTADAALGEIPVFARAGAVVPLFPPGVETLVKETANVPNAASKGADRELRVFAGANGSFVEAGGATFTLTSSATGAGGVPTATWNGASLAPCDDSASTDDGPCLELSAAAGRSVARTVGNGTLALTVGADAVATVAVTKTAENAKQRIVLRY